MTFLELKALTSYWLDDLNQTYFTPTQLGVFLNNALLEAQKLLIGAGQEWYTKCVQTTLVVNQRFYALPDDFLKLNRLEVVVSGSPPNETVNYLMPITPNQRDLVFDQTGTPVAYFFIKNNAVLYPAPNVALTLRLTYSYRVGSMTLDTDQPDVPPQYQELVAILAARDGLIKDTRESALLNQKLAEYMDELKKDAAQRNVDQSRTVIETGSYDDSGYDFY